MRTDDLSPHSMEAEQSVIGALLLDNNSIDKIGELRAEHFYRAEHRTIFSEICGQILSGKTCDVISLFDSLQNKIADCLPYINQISQNTPSAANISTYAYIVIDRAKKRALIAFSQELEVLARGGEAVNLIVDRSAAKLEQIGIANQKQEPLQIKQHLESYVDFLQDRMEGKIKPIPTGFDDLDRRFDGGLERGTLTVVAARPAMGKTAFGLALCRNVAETGASLFLSMEMSATQVNDRNIAALGHIPMAWLKKPIETDANMWAQFTHAVQKAMQLNMHIDDQSSCTLLDIRAKARIVKRKSGLDLLAVDQLSFITGGTGENKAYELGEYTRGLKVLSKELDIAVVLLCQLNRECEKRNNRRPIAADLASSGSIEQDADNILFLYRDEVYNPDTMDKGICEVITVKQRQGEPGTTALMYIGNQTRFENLSYQWKPKEQTEKPRARGFD